MRRKINAFWLVIFILVITIGSGIPVRAADHQTRKTVKVGYVESVNMMEGMSDSEDKSGLGYEYLQRVSYFTNWDYEYVYGEWDEMLSKLMSGEIDVMAGVSKTEEREPFILYPDYPMGSENYYIYVYDDNPLSVRGIEGLKGRSVSVNANSIMETMLREWNDDGNHQMQILTYPGNTQRYEDFDAYLTDATVDTDKAIIPEDRMIPIARIGASDYYLGIAKDRQDLLQELNVALGKIEAIDPTFIKTLSDKYFSDMVVSTRLSQEEKDWLKDHNEIKVGYMNDYLPFSATDDDGHASGIITDIMDEILSQLELTDQVKVTYVGFDKNQLMIKALNQGEVDLTFPVNDNTSYAEKNHIYLSSTVISTAMNLVYKGEYSKLPDDMTIAVKYGNEIQENYTRQMFPKARLVYFSSFEESLDAVNDGKADCIVVNNLRRDAYLKHARYQKLNTIRLPDTSSRCFAVKSGDNELLSILNRGITNLPESYAITSTYQYTNKMSGVTLEDWISEHMVLTILLAILLVLLIVSCILYVIHTRSKRRLLDKLAHNDSLTGLNNRLSFDELLKKIKDIPQDANRFVLAMDLNGLKQANDTLGHEAGDELIQGTADCLRRVLQGYGPIFRVGGDEFVAILTADETTRAQLLYKLKKAFGDWQGVLNAFLSVSVGVCVGDEKLHMKIDEMIKTADQRMYMEKEHYYQQTGMDRRQH